MQTFPGLPVPDTTAEIDPLRPVTPDSVRQAVDSTLAAVAEARDALASGEFWLTVAWTVLRVGLIIALALIVLAVIVRLKRRWVRRTVEAPTLDKRRQRVLTVADLLGSLSRYAVWTIAGFMILDTVGLPIGPLLAGAGIAGLAIGFGAQTFVKDVISGFFLLFDDTLGNGDLIRIGEDVGTVEYVGLRLIKVRKFNGELLMVPAGELRTFGNQSVGFSRVIVNVGLSYEQDVTEALRALEDVAAEWATTEEAKAVMVEEAPEVQGLLDLADSAVTARIIVQVKPGEQFGVDRSIRTLIKKRFDERGVEIPFPRRTVYVKQTNGGEVPPETAAAAGAD